jgi:hypothetical protein
MPSRFLAVLVALLLMAALAGDAVAEPLSAAPAAKSKKKCFKKKRGKRVRVKCPKKKTTPKPTPTPAPAPPMTDPVAISALTTVVSGQLLHHFSTADGPGSFAGDERLYLCGNGEYTYIATLDPAVPGLTNAHKSLERGSWRITGSQPHPDGGFDGGLLLLPADGSSPHLAKLTAATGYSGVIAYVNGAQWYASSTAFCGA